MPSHRLLVRAGLPCAGSRPGSYTWACRWGVRVLGKRGPGRPRRDGPDRAARRCCSRHLLPPRAPYDQTGPHRGVRRSGVQAARTRRGRRLPARAHPRGDVHACWPPPSWSPTGTSPLVLYQVADQVPGRAAARGPGCCAGREFPDEGLVLVRPGRRGPGEGRTRRTGRRTSGSSTGSASTTTASSPRFLRCDGAAPSRRSFLAPTPVGEDTFVSCPGVRVRGERGRRSGVPVTPVEPGAVPPVEVARHPGHAPPSRRWAAHLGVAAGEDPQEPAGLGGRRGGSAWGCPATGRSTLGAAGRGAGPGPGSASWEAADFARPARSGARIQSGRRGTGPSGTSPTPGSPPARRG